METPPEVITSEDGLRRHLIATLFGPLAVGKATPWPADPGAEGDEGIAGTLVYLLEMNEDGWRGSGTPGVPSPWSGTAVLSARCPLPSSSAAH
jgi:hypothetical protein